MPAVDDNLKSKILEMFTSLIDTIKMRTSIDETDLEAVKHSFEPVLVPKNMVLEEKGEVPRHLYFIVSGFLRLFHYNDKGDEITTHINCPPGFITSYSSFINGIKSDEFVESITSCELLRITKANLESLTERSEAIKDFSIAILQESNLYHEKRARDLANLTAEHRYRKLRENYPDILHNVPIQYIASFLGMKPESLSRIRRKMIN